MTDKTTTNPQPQAQDYGEPWEASVYNDEDQEPWDYDDIRNRDGRFILHVSYDEPTRTRDRIIACVNACVGIPNEILNSRFVVEAIHEKFDRMKQKHDEQKGTNHAK